MIWTKANLGLHRSLSIIALMSTLLFLRSHLLSLAQESGEFSPMIAGVTAGIDTLDKVRALYGKGAETTVQDINSLCYYVEEDRGYLSVSSFEGENRIRSIALTTFADVAPGCQNAKIVGKHLTALDSISLGDSTTKINRVLGSPAGNGKVQMANHHLFYTDYRVSGGQLSCQFENDKLVLIAVEVSPGQSNNREQANIVAFAEGAAVRAANFRQGDAAGFTGNREEFTDNAWKDFLNRMQGFLDEKGAPTFSSSFVASGTAKVIDERNGIVRCRIVGTLTHSNQLGKTTYRAALEVVAGGKPVRIQKLEQITCAGASPACQ
jgi:hypothetical protein